MARYLNFFVSLFIFILALPIILISILAVYLNDFGNPIYSARRVGKNFKEFKMLKIRTMIINAEHTGINSTSNNDKRITKIGKIIRKFKIDELLQLLNVLNGEMNIVGPRPNVWADVNKYNNIEKKILTIKPGITDISSIIFSDEGSILKSSKNPDITYDQLIRPWKSRFCLIYIKEQSTSFDLYIVYLTILSLINKKLALNQLKKSLSKLGLKGKILDIAQRKIKLEPSDPPEKDESY
jgi:lipopolysaccharide/colanic/teichoic acid biosynthesis glycosyltransferase